MLKLSKTISVLILTGLISCSESDSPEDINIVDPNFPVPDWTEITHGRVDPDYTAVFSQNKVNTLEIVMTSADWKSVQKDMKNRTGRAFGDNTIGGHSITDDPDYIGVSVKFNNLEWYRVGFRLKGNSSLLSSWRSGIYKLPFRLDFDEFEDDYPQINNQRFYGFKELSMSPAAADYSLIREKVGAEIFRMAGIPVAETAFYKVYIDFGAGLKYCGVYTMVEVVDDTMIENHFGDDRGNIYKPESRFQQFATAEFEKKNNENENDYNDVKAMIATLNSSSRTQNPAQWRTAFESIFNVDHFIKWLAVNTTMHNWDTYGTMAHNYYLYNEPGKGLTWIPWDNNEAMASRGRDKITMSLSDINNEWPLIRYLMDDSVYKAKYVGYVEEFTESVFTISTLNELFDHNHNLIAPYVIGPEETEVSKYSHLPNSAEFTNALIQLKQHVALQVQKANEFLDEN